MKNNGFSLVELVVIIAIIGILLAIGTLNFSAWTKKHTVDKQTLEMLADLNEVRLQAIQKKKDHTVTLQASRYVFAIHSSESDVAGRQILSRNVPYPLRTQTGATCNGETITIDSRGYSTPRKIFIHSPDGGSTGSCIDVKSAKNNLGIMFNVSSCQYK